MHQETLYADQICKDMEVKVVPSEIQTEIAIAVGATTCVSAVIGVWIYASPCRSQSSLVSAASGI